MLTWTDLPVGAIVDRIALAIMPAAWIDHSRSRAGLCRAKEDEMKLGYFTMPLHPPGSDPTETVQHDLDQMVVLDGLGYDEAWIGEHLTAV